MKTLHLTILLLSSFIGVGLAHADNMNGMDMPMKDMPMSGQMDGKTHHTVGIVKKVDTAKSRVTISHEPIASLQWPAMTMAFAVQDKEWLNKLTEGEKIEFDLAEKTKGQYIITKITPAK